MKLITHATALLSVTSIAFAGSSPEVSAPAPASAPVSLGGWFVGGTFGQFDSDSNFADIIPGGELLPGEELNVADSEFDMYTLHVGRDLGQIIGCDMAAFLEVGFMDGDMDINGVSAEFNSIIPTFSNFSERVDLNIIPVTFNLKLERQLFGPVSGYLTAGAGYAFTEASFDGESDRDGGFYAQASFGLIYNFNEQFEVYGGGRWLYLDNLDFGGDGFELDDTLAWELGCRYNF
jgi:opacity protein-like surface antigen